MQIKENELDKAIHEFCGRKRRNSLRCFLGWHEWRWKIPKSGIDLHSPPPNHARCSRCGKQYSESC